MTIVFPPFPEFNLQINESGAKNMMSLKEITFRATVSKDLIKCYKIETFLLSRLVKNTRVADHTPAHAKYLTYQY